MAVAERILNLRPLADTRPDRALVYEAQRGQAEAASVLIERYYPRIYSFVSHLTYGRANAEDLTQEVFARALKALGRFNGQYQFEHWLLRIAKNLCIDEARRNVRSAQLTDPGELPELEGIPAPDYVWETVDRELVASVVHRALSALPARQRAVLVMREMEGMSYADIAQVIGTNPRGVEATLHRARVRFRMEIARAESVEEGQAACRRVLRLVHDDPGASRSQETAAHLAQCTECRRAMRAGGTPARAFGVAPLAGLLGRMRGWASLRGRAGLTASVRRLPERLKDSASLAGLNSTAAFAAPLARMAEVTAGVVVVTVVAVAPTLPAFTPVTATTAAYAPAEAQATVPQVGNVPNVVTPYRASASSPVVFGSSGAIQLQPGSQPVPSLQASPDAGVSGLLGGLGLTPVQNLLGTTLDNVGTVGDILASQLNQVAELANRTVSGALAPLGAPVAPLAETVTTTVNTLTGGLATTVKGVETPLKNAGSKLSGAASSPLP